MESVIDSAGKPPTQVCHKGLQTQRGYLQCFEIMVNFWEQTTPYPLLEIENDEQYSPASVLTLKVHPPGLPVHETFFDEVVPLAKELSQTDQHSIGFGASSKEVSVLDWVNFWFKGPEWYK
ncbi:hypothetical protein BC332_17796 [Capsicum chinense]|nr:hypothetical protein BC332_17796 [Capsicum chinense]